MMIDLIDANEGSNSKPVAIERLRSCIERIERVQEEQKALQTDVKDIFLELKSAGFDTKVVRELLRLRKMDPNDLEEREALLDVYRQAIGMA